METLQNFRSMINNKLEPQMRNHLKNVYGCIASSTLVAAAGAYSHCNGIWEGGLLSMLGSIILLTMMAFSRNPEGKDDGMRFLYLNGFALCTGLSTGPLIERVWDLEPSIVVSALMYTCVIFTCFTISALIAPDGKYLALGGPLLSILSTMLLASILNIFVRSPTFVYMQLILGLVIMSAFILYDTQMIMEKVRMGDKDYVWHSLTLFMDLASIFKHILVLLADKEQNSRNRKRSSR
ncbi:probable Bax inhibitor 1 [Folsomia candida]|uniref:Putative Bax inhibitor 1 n=1 Tax=Folsomia candida TaxID=158441 RepID=A0A226EF34_FOLCA|nr:probable Bax inhibitor 1 [Folsomia candida]OXA55431.1 putative Bax inhibitor 1 [Folsomia candida]